MDNQHQKIKGYRDLTQEEIDLMNEVKAHGDKFGELLAGVGQLPDIDPRALAIGKTELQTGVMWAVRAIARPTTF